MNAIKVVVGLALDLAVQARPGPYLPGATVIGELWLDGVALEHQPFGIILHPMGLMADAAQGCSEG